MARTAPTHGRPAIYMMTPSGRFDTTKKLCLSLSDFHPESWSPAWNVSSILVGSVGRSRSRPPLTRRRSFLSFMLEEEITAGSIKVGRSAPAAAGAGGAAQSGPRQTTRAEKVSLAAKSLAYNMQNPTFRRVRRARDDDDDAQLTATRRRELFPLLCDDDEGDDDDDDGGDDDADGAPRSAAPKPTPTPTTPTPTATTLDAPK